MASVIVERSSLLPAILPGMTREKPTASSLADLAELVLDMASVIVDRSSLLPAILPGTV